MDNEGCINRGEKRIEYIDAIKGLAILLMVMGHECAWMVGDYREIQKDASVSYLWCFIYSFHMPLFMFASGYLFGLKTNVSIFEYFRGLLRRTQSLIVPFIVAGLIFHYVMGGQIAKYWFLATLFVLIAGFGFLDLLILRVSHNYRIVAEGATWICAYGAIFWALRHLGGNYYASYILVRLKTYFWFFATGSFISRHGMEYVFDRRILYTVSLAGVPALFATGGFAYPNKAVAWLMIYIVWFLFRHTTLNSGGKLLANLGRHSLEIYVIHFFCLIKLPMVGAYFHSWVLRFPCCGGMTNVSLQFIYCLLTSAFVIGVCYLVMFILQQSPILYRIILGRVIKPEEGVV